MAPTPPAPPHMISRMATADVAAALTWGDGEGVSDGQGHSDSESIDFEMSWNDWGWT